MAVATEKIRPITIEDRLAIKFDDLQVAREDRVHDLFDEIVKSIEVLFKALPNAYNELMEEKRKLNIELQKELLALREEANQARDDIDKQKLINEKSYRLHWEYRDIIEEIIMEVMQKNNLVIFGISLTPAEVEPKQTTSNDYAEQRQEEPTYYEPVEEQQETKPVKKKPHLSINPNEDLEV